MIQMGLTQTEIIDGWTINAIELCPGRYSFTAVRDGVFVAQTIKADNIDDAIADAYHELCQEARK